MRLFLTLLIVSSFSVAPLWAETFSEDNLPEITVVDTSAITTSGSSVLDRQTLQSLPQGDGAITDLLKVLPGIQFSEADNSSLTGGEILPAEISISGGRVYDNNFMIDGISNNSLLDPTSNNPHHFDDIPGHSQELFLDSSLIESVTVQRSNISARYSGFTGGVVDMNTRNPAEKFGGEISFRTTRSEWTSFNIDREDREGFEKSETHKQQPKFREYYGALSFDLPINEQMGFLLAYSNIESRIPLELVGDKHKQSRSSENWFAKYRFQPNDRTDLTITAIWTPYEGDYFTRNAINSDFTVEGGGVSFNATLKRTLPFAELELLLGWRESENSRSAPTNLYSWDPSVESTDWGLGYSGFSIEGGYGDVENELKTLTTAGHLSFNTVEIGRAEHTILTGLTIERSQADHRRPETTSLTTWVANEAVICLGDDPYCIDGEQFAYKRIVYGQEDADAEVTFFDFYLEDTIKVKRITLRPGLHVGYNDLAKNTDYAARGAIFYDVFGDSRTILSAGANRYYGKTFLTYALAEGRLASELYKRSRYKVKDPITKKSIYEIQLQADGTPEAWVGGPSFNREKNVSSLDTPYVDEWTVGLEQELLGGLLAIAYIDRNGEDNLAYSDFKTDDGSYRILNNNGDSRHKELTMSWQRQWGQNFLLINGTWQRSFSSNEDYADELDLEELEEQVWYNGHTTYLIDLPRSDHNREWSANLIYSAKLPYGFSFTNITRYRSGYEAIGKTDQDKHELPDGEKLYVYDNISYSSATTFDWKIEWEYPVTEIQRMTISADVTNVFNRKIYTGIDGQYQMGRQLWVGVDYSF